MALELRFSRGRVFLHISDAVSAQVIINPETPMGILVEAKSGQWPGAVQAALVATGSAEITPDAAMLARDHPLYFTARDLT